MKKKLLFLFLFGFCFLFLINKQDFSVVYSQEICGLPLDWCRQAIGSPFSNTCCRVAGGCWGSGCGFLNQWDWCYVSSCCAYNTLDPANNCTGTPADIGLCWYSFDYGYQKSVCEAVDSCLSAPYLEAGLCDGGGCSVGGDYKTCCQGGQVVNCGGGQFSGSCPPGSTAVANCVGPLCCTSGAPPSPSPGVTPVQVNPDCGGCNWWQNQFNGCGWCTNSADCDRSGMCVTGKISVPSCPECRAAGWTLPNCHMCCDVPGDIRCCGCVGNPPAQEPEPPPTCSSSSSFSAFSSFVYQGESIVLLTNVANLSPSGASITRVDFSSNNTNIATVGPSSDSTAPYLTNIVGQGLGTATITANVYLNPGDVLGCSNVVQIVVIHPLAWFQTQGGNVHGNNVASRISRLATNRFFSLNGAWGQSGFVSARSHLPTSQDNFNGAQVSQGNPSWQTRGNLNALRNRYRYSHFISLLDVNEANEEIAFQEENTLTNPASLERNIVVYSSGDGRTMNINDWAIGDAKKIVFVDGDLNINNQITVGPNGFLAVIVSGDLTIDVGTTNLASTNPQVQGVFLVDGQITTVKNDAEPKFVGEGVFFSGGGFSLNKDLGVGNTLNPAELFIFNPRHLFNAPEFFRSSHQIWQEVAP